GGRHLHYRHLHIVDWRQRVEEAVELLSAIPANPELTGRRPEIQRRCFEAVDVHRVPQDSEVAVLFRKALREPGPRIAAILATPDGGHSAWTRAGLRLERHDVHGVGALWMDDDGKSKVRR